LGSGIYFQLPALSEEDKASI